MTEPEGYIERPSLGEIEKIDTFKIKLYRERNGGYNTKSEWLKEIQPWSKEKWLDSEKFIIDRKDVFNRY